MRPRILFVDDHEDTRNLISYGLDSLGYEVVVTDCTAEGLRLAREERFDLYLLDSQFAEGSGAELCEAIREFDAATPIIYFTGEHPSLLKGALDCPVQGLVMKPDFDELREKITQTLRPAA
jgi:two-component system, OmpR family, phosphate regulon response regulator PhoB